MRAHSGISYARLRKAFRARFGVSPGRYRIERRLALAASLLRHDGRGVAEVAAILGYPSPFAFSAQFRARFGKPPSRWA